jgi:hypothetical protein
LYKIEYFFLPVGIAALYFFAIDVTKPPVFVICAGFFNNNLSDIVERSAGIRPYNLAGFFLILEKSTPTRVCSQRVSSSELILVDFGRSKSFIACLSAVFHIHAY